MSGLPEACSEINARGVGSCSPEPLNSAALAQPLCNNSEPAGQLCTQQQCITELQRFATRPLLMQLPGRLQLSCRSVLTGKGLPLSFSCTAQLNSLRAVITYGASSHNQVRPPCKQHTRSHGQQQQQHGEHNSCICTLQYMLSGPAPGPDAEQCCAASPAHKPQGATRNDEVSPMNRVLFNETAACLARSTHCCCWVVTKSAAHVVAYSGCVQMTRLPEIQGR